MDLMIYSDDALDIIKLGEMDQRKTMDYFKEHAKDDKAQVKAIIGAYAAEMGGLDNLVFTGGIGENSEYVREKVCEKLAFLVLKRDAGGLSKRQCKQTAKPATCMMAHICEFGSSRRI